MVSARCRAIINFGFYENQTQILTQTTEEENIDKKRVLYCRIRKLLSFEGPFRLDSFLSKILNRNIDK